MEKKSSGKLKIQNKEATEFYCVLCLNQASEFDHFQTRGAHGRSLDVESNLNPLCRHCHTLRHRCGIRTFWNRYSNAINKHRKLQGLCKLEPFWNPD